MASLMTSNVFVMARIIFVVRLTPTVPSGRFLGIAHLLTDWHPPLQALLLYDQYPQKSFKKISRLLFRTFLGRGVGIASLGMGLNRRTLLPLSLLSTTLALSD